MLRSLALALLSVVLPFALACRAPTAPQPAAQAPQITIGPHVQITIGPHH
jgi:hypothetical protein